MNLPRPTDLKNAGAATRVRYDSVAVLIMAFKELFGLSSPRPFL
jgi:hypothetical protein